MKLRFTRALLASGLIAAAAASCSSEDATLVWDDEDGALVEKTADARVRLSVGDRDVGEVTATLSGDGFETETHVIDVDDSGVVSALFGGLPAGDGYDIELSGGECRGSARFGLTEAATTL